MTARPVITLLLAAVIEHENSQIHAIDTKIFNEMHPEIQGVVKNTMNI